MQLTPAGCFCGMACAMGYARKKIKIVKEKAHTERKKEFKLSDTSYQHKLTIPVFNKMRVLQEKKWFGDRGLQPYCISCLKQNMDWCCGHFKTSGGNSRLRYDPMNTFLQCNRYCNMGLSGNIEGNKNTIGYKAGLVERFGKEKAKEILDYCDENTHAKNWTGEELKKMRAEFSKEIRRLS
jgi:hypothetical protein